MNILLIGGCGYIGSALFSRFRDKHSVWSCDLNLFGCNNAMNWCCNYNKLEKTDIEKFDVVILTAAHSSVPLCNEDHAGALQNNIYNFINLVQKLNKNQKLIYASSSCVYVKTDLKGAVETNPLSPNDMLSFSKATIDQYLQTFNPCEYYGLRFGSVNGWSENFRSDLIVNSMAVNAIKHRELHVSNGDNYRPILGMEDLLNAVVKIVECPEDRRGIYNLASFNVNIRQVGHAVSDILECKVNETPGLGSYDFCINSDKFKKTYGFEFFDTLESIVTSITDRQDIILNRDFPARKASLIYGKI